MFFSASLRLCVKSFKNFLVPLLLITLTLHAYAWDSAGHRLISAIAYANLTPAARQAVDRLTLIEDPGYPPLVRFLYISTLPDLWRKDNPATASWHFINQPWSSDGAPTPPVSAPNLLTALQQNQATLINPDASQAQRATALAFVVHLTEDAHQPLHTLTRVSHAFPHGDLGGNDFPINSRYATNLHAYWDQAVRLLLKPSRHYPPGNRQIQRLAYELQQRYPRSSFSSADDLAADHWVQQSFTLGTQVAYQLTPGAKLKAAYVNQVRETAGQQMVLAGYRLAGVLNQIK